MKKSNSRTMVLPAVAALILAGCGGAETAGSTR